MKRWNRLACVLAWPMTAFGAELHVVGQVADANSSTGFSVGMTLYSDSEPSQESFIVHYRTDQGTSSVDCSGSTLCWVDVDPYSDFEIIEPTASRYEIQNDVLMAEISPSINTAMLGSRTEPVALAAIDAQPVTRSLVDQINRNADRLHYQFDAVIQRRSGWEMRSGAALQQLSLMGPAELPISINLSREQVGPDSRSRVDMVAGQAWRQGLWQLALLGSVGGGRLQGVQSTWYAAGIDAWYGQGYSGPFLRMNQQFSNEAGRSVAGLQLADWQDQSLLTAIGWRVKQRQWGLNWDGDLGLERSTHKTVGMVGDGNQWQAIGAIPDQQGGYLSLGIGNKTRESSWRVGLRHFRQDSQLVLNWGW